MMDVAHCVTGNHTWVGGGGGGANNSAHPSLPDAVCAG